MGVLVCFGGAILTLPRDRDHRKGSGATSRLPSNAVSSGNQPPSGLLDYPKTLADLLVQERLRAEQVAVEAAELAEAEVSHHPCGVQPHPLIFNTFSDWQPDYNF